MATVADVAVACAEDGTITTLVVVDLACLAVGVASMDEGLVLAVPAAASGDPNMVTEPVETITRMGRKSVKASVRFMVLSWETPSEALDDWDPYTMDLDEFYTFFEKTSDVPSASVLTDAWTASRNPASADLPAAPLVDAPAQGKRAAKSIPKAAPKAKVTTIAGLASMLAGRLDGIEGRLVAVELGGPASPIGVPASPVLTGAATPIRQLTPTPPRTRDPPVHGILGTLAPQGPQQMGGANALNRARELLGVGAQEPQYAPPGAGRGEGRRPRDADEDEQASPDATLNKLVELLSARQQPSAGELFGIRGDGHINPEEYNAGTSSFLGGGGRSAGAGGVTNLERLISTRRAHPEVIVSSNEQMTRESLGTLPGEAWSVQLHSDRHVQPHVPTFTTLRRMTAILAAALDEGRVRGAVHQHAFLWHAYRVIESACLQEDHDLGYAWPLLGINDPGGRPRGGMAPVELATLAAYHRERQSYDSVRRGGDGGGGNQGGGGGRKGERKGESKKSSDGAAHAKAAAKTG